MLLNAATKANTSSIGKVCLTKYCRAPSIKNRMIKINNVSDHKKEYTSNNPGLNAIVASISHLYKAEQGLNRLIIRLLKNITAANNKPFKMAPAFIGSMPVMKSSNHKKIG